MGYDEEKRLKFFTYSSLDDIDRRWYKCNILLFLQKLVWEYIHFLDWYSNLFLEDNNLQKCREIIICERNCRIVGVAILKKTVDEQKICTLRVEKNFQKMGIGSKLMEYSFEWLENDKPFITFHKAKQKDFESLLKRYNFKLNQVNKMYYGIFNTELAYNGELPSRKIILNPIETTNIMNTYCHMNFLKYAIGIEFMYEFKREISKKERQEIKYSNEYPKVNFASYSPRICAKDSGWV